MNIILSTSLPILFGWFLGLFAPLITSYIADNRKWKRVKNNILLELEDIKNRLVLIPFKIYPQYSMLDDNIFTWIKDQTKNFQTLDMDVKIRELALEAMNNAESRARLIADFNGKSQRNNPGINFKKFSLSLIDAHILNASLLDEEFLIALLEIKFQVNVLNEEIQTTHDDRNLTFNPDITSENHGIILSNIQSSNLFIAERAMIIVDKINSIQKLI